MLIASLLYALSAYERFHSKAPLLYSGGKTCICVSSGPPLTTRGDRGKGVCVGKIFFEHIIFFIVQMKDCLSIVKQGSQTGKWGKCCWYLDLLGLKVQRSYVLRLLLASRSSFQLTGLYKFCINGAALILLASVSLQVPDTDVTVHECQGCVGAALCVTGTT